MVHPVLLSTMIEKHFVHRYANLGFALWVHLTSSIILSLVSVLLNHTVILPESAVNSAGGLALLPVTKCTPCMPGPQKVPR
jgi:hypothetical protein